MGRHAPPNYVHKRLGEINHWFAACHKDRKTWRNSKMNSRKLRSWGLGLSVVVGTVWLTTGQFSAVGKALFSSPAHAQQATPKYGVSIMPEWNEKGELIRPKGFRSSWVYLGSPFTPNSLNDGAANFPEYHNVYTQPSAFHHYRATGKWPEGTIMLKEL